MKFGDSSIIYEEIDWWKDTVNLIDCLTQVSFRMVWEIGLCEFEFFIRPTLEVLTANDAKWLRSF